MNITTKFNVGEQVYFLEEGSLFRRPVQRITVEIKNSSSDKIEHKIEPLIIYYFILYPTVTGSQEKYKYENEVAATKEELINNLQVS